MKKIINFMLIVLSFIILGSALSTGVLEYDVATGNNNTFIAGDVLITQLIGVRNGTDVNFSGLTINHKVNLSNTGNVNATKFYGSELILGNISTDGNLTFRVSGDNDDYLVFTTVSNIPRLHIEGHTELYMTSSEGSVGYLVFEDSSNWGNVGWSNAGYMHINSLGGNIRIYPSQSTQYIEFQSGTEMLIMTTDTSLGNPNLNITPKGRKLFLDTNVYVGKNKVNLSDSGDVRATNFYGSFYNWKILDGVSQEYLTFSGIDLSLTESKLNATILSVVNSTTYFPYNITTVTGTRTSGNIISISFPEDVDAYNVTEESSGANPLTIVINYSGVVNFDFIEGRIYYKGGKGHEVNLEVWREDLGTWDNIEEFTDMIDYNNVHARVFDPQNHILNGVVSVRINHEQNGKPNHAFSIDYLTLLDGVTTVTSSDHDGLGGRDNRVNHPWAMPTDGSRNFTGYLNVTEGLNVKDKVNLSTTGDVNATKLYVTDGYFGGNVGIGTDSLTHELNVVGDVNITGMIITGISTGHELRRDGKIVGQIQAVDVGGSRTLTLTTVNNPDGFPRIRLVAKDNTPIEFFEGSTRVATISNTGLKVETYDFIVDNTDLFVDVSASRVGIGTANPLVILDVGQEYSGSGHINFAPRVVSNSYSDVNVFNRANFDTVSIGRRQQVNNSLVGLKFLTTTGASTQGARIIYSSEDATGLTAGLHFQVGSGSLTKAMTILKGGNVNISKRLTVGGNVSITGNLSADNVISDGKFSLGGSEELVISGGVITITKSYHRIDTENNDATDNLDTINGGTHGQLLLIKAATGTRTVVVKDETGNINLPADFSLDSSADTLYLYYSLGSNQWRQVCSSNNG